MPRRVVLTLGLLLGSAGSSSDAADPAQGADLYRRWCVNCHGPAGRPVLPGAPDFSRATSLLRSDLELMTRIRDGRGAMPAFQGQLRDREILDVVAHLRTLR
jgi:cytochrome c6